MKDRIFDRIRRRNRRKRRIRKKVFGTSGRPRLSVFRSNRYIYGQIVDDHKGITLASAGDRSQGVAELFDSKKKGKVGKSFAAGKLLAAHALEKGIESIVFDRGGYLYHGRVKAFAEGARAGGLKF
ncbi:MAG: 50S ribosomal protein L18 [Candidatus Cloacimonetes bacterium 4572_55]|nr:MAG: 50S ribosomal protein L18 [Candidatus Cloacimonetes bacterium 4572_55]